MTNIELLFLRYQYKLKKIDISDIYKLIEAKKITKEQAESIIGQMII